MGLSRSFWSFQHTWQNGLHLVYSVVYLRQPKNMNSPCMLSTVMTIMCEMIYDEGCIDSVLPSVIKA